MIRNSSAEKLPVPDDREEINSSEKTEETVENPDDEPEPHRDEDDIATKEEAMHEIERVFKSDKDLLNKLEGFATGFLYRLDYEHKLLRLGADNIVGMCIEKICYGNRKWDKNKHPNIVEFMNHAIVSIIRDELKRKKEIKCIPINDIQRAEHSPDQDKQELENMLYMDNINIQGEVTTSASENAQMKSNDSPFCDDQTENEEFIISNFEKGLEDDTNAYYVLQERMKGNKSNIAISKELGISVVEVENALKRIKRKIVSFKK
ncbi:MAG: hypothetical protein IPJ03_00230 [Ignavibacteriales bacterium]|nr:hypothetical protein [Ignavibacteriales bacterium]